MLEFSEKTLMCLLLGLEFCEKNFEQNSRASTKRFIFIFRFIIKVGLSGHVNAPVRKMLRNV